MDYQEINVEDRLAAAKGRLRGIENDHFTLTLTDEQKERQAELESQAEGIKKTIAELEKEAAKAPAKSDAAS